MNALIARKASITQLSATLEESLSGRFKIVFITGEAGIGKTTLLEHFASLAQAEHPELFVAGSKCRNLSGSQQEPYLPFVQILETLLTPGKDRPILDSLKRGLAEVAPDWIGTIPVVGGFIAATFRTAQWANREFGSSGNLEDLNPRLLQYTKALLLAAEQNPLLLWIDDLHWSDSATLDLIGFLADHAQESRIMLIATYRPTDIAFEVDGQPHPVSKLVDKLKRYKQCSTIKLTSFDQSELETYLTMFGYSFSDEFKKKLLKESGGNPLFVKEYLILLHKDRKLRRREGRFMLASPEISVEVPVTVRAVIDQRLGLIGKQHRDILLHASVQGEVFSPHVVADLLDISETQLLKELHEIEYEHQLIREAEILASETAKYQFTPELVRNVLYDGIGVGHKRHLHLIVAQSLQHSSDQDKEAFAADIAVHYEKAGRLLEAVEHYLKAANSALRLIAMSDASNHLSSAERLIQTLGDKNAKRNWRIAALLIRAEIDFFLAKHELVLAHCTEGESLCMLGDFADEHAFFLYWRSRAQYALGRRGESVHPIKQAIELVEQKTTDFRLLGYLYARLGLLYTVLPLEEVQEALIQSYEIAGNYDFPDLLSLILMRQGWIAMNLLDSPNDAVDYGMKALEIAKANQLLYIQIHSHRLVAYASRRIRQDDTALWHNERAVKAAEKSGLPRPLFNALYSLANSRKELESNWQESLSLMNRAMEITERYQFSFSIFAFNLLSHLTIGLGLWSEAESAHQNYESHIDDSYLRPLGFYHRQRAHLEFARGEYSKAINAYELAQTTFAEYSVNERDLMIIEPFWGLALAHQTNHTFEINERLEELKAYWKERSEALYSQTLHSLGRLHRAQGNHQYEEECLRAALDSIGGSMQGGPWPVWPYVSMDMGSALLRLEKLEEAQQHAQFAYDAFSRIGHFLKGDAAFVLAKVLNRQSKLERAVRLLNEAKDDWLRLGLVYKLDELEVFLLEHGLEW